MNLKQALAIRDNAADEKGFASSYKYRAAEALQIAVVEYENAAAAYEQAVRIVEHLQAEQPDE